MTARPVGPGSSGAHVLATAGHVDHGKSTLVRALTGMEPDRWEQERRRGLTIDLGYVWADLPGGGQVAFVDVPGHRRFIGNMLAGLGPSPAVLFVVAADQGWQAQSEEHLRAAEALRVSHGLLVVTRSDLADPGQALTEAGERLARGSLASVTMVAVSAVTGVGLDCLRSALVDLCARLPVPEPDGRVRLWVDRAFTVHGSGTVVTGTLGAGSLSVGQTLALAGRAGGNRVVSVRGLQALGRSRSGISAPARVAVNLRGVPVEDVGRGDALLTPEAWLCTSELDVVLDAPAAELPTYLHLHLGTAATPARVRPLAGRAARVRLARGLPLQVGDRAILRDPGRSGAITGLRVVDVQPPALTRRGAGAGRGEQLLAADGHPSLAEEVLRRGHVDLATARLLGFGITGYGTPDLAQLRGDGAAGVTADLSSHLAAQGIQLIGDRLVAADTWRAWRQRLLEVVDRRAKAEPLASLLTLEAAREAAGIPSGSPDLLTELVHSRTDEDQPLAIEGGRIGRPGTRPDLGGAQAGLDTVLARLAAQPFDAPQEPELTELGLGPRQIAAAQSTGQLIRLGRGGNVLLLPDAPALAVDLLRALPQPFTTSQARQQLGSTRRVVIPLLEHLDACGLTRRIDAAHREVVPPPHGASAPR